jgi:hypothetical protein
MVANSDHDDARLQRLLEACRKGLDHDLPNQLVALHGLLQLLKMEESDRLSPAGLDYLQRLVRVVQRTQALARTLKELARLGSGLPSTGMVALPELVEEVLAEWQVPPVCSFVWDAPRVRAPRSHLHQTVAQILRLLLESLAGEPAQINFISRPAPPGIELSLQLGDAAQTDLSITPSAPLLADMPAVWHERVECVLIRELVAGWGGTVLWRKDGDRLGVTMTLPAPR